MFGIHWHHPVPTAITINAGFRKGNEPRGTWSFFSADKRLWVCDCVTLFVEVRDRLIELEGIEDDECDRVR